MADPDPLSRREKKKTQEKTFLVDAQLENEVGFGKFGFEAKI